MADASTATATVGTDCRHFETETGLYARVSTSDQTTENQLLELRQYATARGWTPAGRLQPHLLAAIAEFERSRIVERVRAGMARAKKDGTRLGRRPHRITDDDLARVEHLSPREAAKALGVPRSVLQRARPARKGPRQETSFAPDLPASAERDLVAL